MKIDINLSRRRSSDVWSRRIDELNWARSRNFHTLNSPSLFVSWKNRRLAYALVFFFYPCYIIINLLFIQNIIRTLETCLPRLLLSCCLHLLFSQQIQIIKECRTSSRYFSCHLHIIFAVLAMYIESSASISLKNV